MKRKSRRYFLVKLVCDKKIERDSFSKAVRESALKFFGESGLAQLDMRFLGFRPDSWEAIISCRTAASDKLRASLAMVTEFNGEPGATFVLRASGTMKGLERS